MSDHKHQEKQGDLQDLVQGIRSAEQEADNLKTNYGAKVAELLKKGREKSVEMRELYEKKAAEAKNRVLVGERHKTEKMVEETVSEAKKQAASLRTKKLSNSDLDTVFENFVSKL